MPTEWYWENLTTEVEDHELKQIQKQLPDLISTINDTSIDLESFDQDGVITTICRDGKSTGIKITHAIYGNPEFQLGEETMKYEELCRISIHGEYVTILLNPDGSINKIQTNINRETPYAIYRWLGNAYQTIESYLINNEAYYLERENFLFHGEEETRQIKELNKNLGR